MPTSSDSEQVIKRLVQLTQEGRLKWVRDTNTGYLTQGTEDIVESVYSTTLHGHQFRLYQARYRDYSDEVQYSWDTTNRLETVDSQNHLLWRFPSSRWTAELFHVATYQTAEVDKMFKDILTDEKG